MYNNNYGASNTRKDFPWDSYELVESFDTAYSSIVSSVQDVEDNHVTSSGKSNCYAEYDENGQLIKHSKNE